MNAVPDSLKQNRAYGTNSLCGFFGSLCEESSFFLVVVVMMPNSAGRKKLRADLQKFIFCGFLKKEELANAIVEQNP